MFYKFPSTPLKNYYDVKLRTWAKYERTKVELKNYRGEDYVEKAIELNIPKGELLLGTQDEERKIPVTLPYNNKSFAMLVLANKGDGKTQWIKTQIFPQLHDVYGLNVFLVDPKGDYENLHKAMREQNYVDMLKPFNIKCKGYSSISFNPFFLNLYRRKGIEYQLKLQNFKELEITKRETLFRNLCHLKEIEPASHALSHIAGASFPPAKIEDVKKLLDKARKFTLKTRIEAGGRAGMAVSTKLDVAFSNLTKENIGLLGDKSSFVVYEDVKTGTERRKKLPYVNFAQELATHRIIRQNTDLEGGDSHYQRIYFAMGLGSIWTDRVRRIESKGLEGYNERPVVIALDEADVFLPAGRLTDSSKQMIQLLTRGRLYGFNVYIITQKPKQLNDKFVANTDYIVTTRVNEDTKPFIKQKYPNLPKYLWQEVENLKYNRTDPTKNQWVLFTGNPDDPVRIFYALPPNIEIMREASVV